MSIDDLKPIQRYEIESAGANHGTHWLDASPNKDGGWCKYEDVEKVLDEVNNILLEHLSDILKDNSKNLNNKLN